MRAGVVVFPGSNCDRDLALGFQKATGRQTTMIWHKDTALPTGLDVIGIPGGFSFGDYLRCGAIAAKAPVMRAVAEFAAKGGHVIGICNGFQVLTETGMLPGVLMRNAALKYVCRTVPLSVTTTNSPYTNAYAKGQELGIPVAHHEGNYIAEPDLLSRLEGEDRVAFRYLDNPNGAMADIAGILSENRRVLGMMPHPERANEPALGGTDGAALFDSISAAFTVSA